MKVIFLDFDGVLNSAKYLLGHGDCGVAIDPARMALLKQIVDATDAKIVLSTSWREHWSKDLMNCDGTGVLINRIFSKYGLDDSQRKACRRNWKVQVCCFDHSAGDGLYVDP